MERGKRVCDRCKRWHQRLFRCWDNMEEKTTLICLDCLAELIGLRLPRRREA